MLALESLHSATMPFSSSATASREDNHRTRVGAERREKTRARLLECALIVFARRGLTAGVIDDVITMAGMSRGTFYNYFRTNEDLFLGVAEEVGNEFIRCVDPLVVEHSDPGARVAAGLRYSLLIARQYPTGAAFIVKGGATAIRNGEATRNVARDVSAGIAKGRFSPIPEMLVQDIVFGSIASALESVLHPNCDPAYPDLFAQSILQALGVPRQTAQRLARAPLAPLILPEDSLLVRAGAS